MLAMLYVPTLLAVVGVAVLTRDGPVTTAVAGLWLALCGAWVRLSRSQKQSDAQSGGDSSGLQ